MKHFISAALILLLSAATISAQQNCSSAELITTSSCQNLNRQTSNHDYWFKFVTNSHYQEMTAFPISSNSGSIISVVVYENSCSGLSIVDSSKLASNDTVLLSLYNLNINSQYYIKVSSDSSSTNFSFNFCPFSPSVDFSFSNTQVFYTGDSIIFENLCKNLPDSTLLFWNFGMMYDTSSTPVSYWVEHTDTTYFLDSIVKFMYYKAGIFNVKLSVRINNDTISTEKSITINKLPNNCPTYCDYIFNGDFECFNPVLLSGNVTGIAWIPHADYWWFNVNNINNPASPDYYNTVCNGTAFQANPNHPQCNFGSFSLYDGQGCGGLVTHDVAPLGYTYREYISQQFQYNLNPNFNYKLSFYLRLAPKSDLATVFGFMISDTPIYTTSGSDYLITTTGASNTYIEHTTSAVTNTNWQKFTFIVDKQHINSNMNSIHFGRFDNLQNTDFQYVTQQIYDPNYDTVSFYLIDSISFVPYPLPELLAEDVEFCLGSSVDISATPGFDNYSWSTGQTGQTITVSPTNSTTYAVTATINGFGINGCPQVAICTTNMIKPEEFEIIGPRENCDAANIFEYSIVDPDPNASYEWDISSWNPNSTANLQISGDNISFYLNQLNASQSDYPFHFVVTATVDYGNTICESTQEYWLFNCCDGIEFDHQFYDTYIDGDYSGETLFIQGTVTIDQGTQVNLDGCTIKFGKWARINVESDAYLNINDCDLKAVCKVPWDGIYIRDNTSLVTCNNTSTIKDALNAFVSLDGGVFEIDECEFIDNYYGILVKKYDYDHDGYVYNTDFLGDAQLLMFPDANLPLAPQYPYTDRPYAGIKIVDVGYPNSVQGITIGDENQVNNSFTGLCEGIQIYRSRANIYNNTFENITSVSPAPPSPVTDGRAIYTEGNKSDIMPSNCDIRIGDYNSQIDNTFTNCTYGIYSTDNVNLDIEYNTITNAPALTGIGVYYGENEKSNSVNISHNTMSNLYLVGIHAYMNLDCYSHIFCNDISWTKKPYGKGIILSEFSPSYTTAQYVVENNTIENTLIGIKSQNVFSPYIKYNIIEIANVPTSYSTGIKVLDNISSLIEGNYISSSSTDDRIHGIYASVSPDLLVKCNEIDNVGTCMKFAGSCPSVLKSNLMANSYYGLTLYNTGVIGQQGSTNNSWDNKWNNNTKDTYCFQSYGSTSTLYTKTNGYYNPTIISGSDFSPPGNAFNKLYTGGPYLTCNTPANPCGGGLFSISSMNSTLLTTDTIALEQYLNNSIGGAGSVFTPLTSEDKWLRDFVNWELLSLKNPIFNSGTKSIYYDSLKFSNSAILTTAVNYMNTKNINEASVLINSYMPSNTIEHFEKQIHQKWIEKFENNGIIDTSMLMYLANSCPFTEGIAVYRARAILSKYYPEIEFKDNCSNQIEIGSNKSDTNNIQEANHSRYLTVYPNPTKAGKITLACSENIPSSSMITFLNYEGKTVLNTSWSGNKTCDIDISTLSKGLYFVTIYSNNGYIYNAKLEIID